MRARSEAQAEVRPPLAAAQAQLAEAQGDARELEANTRYLQVRQGRRRADACVT